MNEDMYNQEPTIVPVTKNNNSNCVIAGNHRMQAMQSILPKRGRGRPEKVSKEMFTEAWNKCDSLKEVAELLGIPSTSASVKASNLRKAGRELKKYKRGAKRKTACIAG
jgi:hypothetical protein|tara:strand:+ start:581 stop:907 length:327 start_codon:yes stop_codon:yes gene_type:complete